jgi:arylsulfatase A-like enzyme
VTDDIEAFAGRLRALPGWDDTLFCITSDHGEGLSDHPAVSHSKGHGALLYSSMVQVPWILFNAAWTPARSRVSQDVRLLELAPTLLDLVGIDPPSAGIAGRSLRPLIDGKALSVSMPDYIITETYFRNFRKISVHGPEWQYVHNRGSVQRLPEHELQSRAGRANGALTDVAADHQDVVERMRRYLQAWESRHAEAPAVAADEVLSEDVLRQLEALGYTR